MVTVAPNAVAFCSQAPDDFGVSRDLLADDEECRPDTASAQDVEQYRIRSVVEGQANCTAAGRSMRHEQPPGKQCPHTFSDNSSQDRVRTDSTSFSPAGHF